MKENVHIHVNTYSYGLISVWVISITDVNKTMFLDTNKITLKRKINSKTVLRDFVVLTCRYDHSKYSLNDQQTIIITWYSSAICKNGCGILMFLF